VHGSPRDCRNEYILETDITFGNVDKIEEIFELVPRLCFVGHTHVPGVITEDFQFLTPPDFNMQMDLDPKAKYILNISAVGQPRDGDNRACYALVEGNRVTYRRVPYDYKKTMSKMHLVGSISKEAAERLEQGR
jgi:diadenosine tetraphosphatase ApaH/serine/threonine PP2A family protein phosphatase